jgi:uncharacterized repeat protein (TIGR01451 family)
MIAYNRPFSRLGTLKLLMAVAAIVSCLLLVQMRSAEAHTVTNNGFTLTNEATPDPATVGKQMTFLIMETNNSGSTQAFTMGISDLLPAGLRFVSATIDEPGGMCSFDANTNTVSCKGFTLQNGQTATIVVTVIPTMSGSFTNHVDDFGHAGPVDEPFMVKKSASHNHNHHGSKHHGKHKHH